jgi:anti-sigma B factor antagonist
MDRWTIESTGDGCFGASIEGDLDLANGRDLVHKLGGLLACSVNRIELDLSGVEFIDSCGLQALLNTHRLAAGSGCEIVFTALSPPVERLFELTRCIEVFNLVRVDTPAGRSQGGA